ncbi:hypothetical protein Tco_0546072 [Tanacetum coccineum]
MLRISTILKNRGTGVNLQSGKVVVVGKKQKVRRRIRQEVEEEGGRKKTLASCDSSNPCWEVVTPLVEEAPRSRNFWVIQDKGYKMNFDLRHPLAGRGGDKLLEALVKTLGHLFVTDAGEGAVLEQVA